MVGGKVFQIVDGDISDGYHTFSELYDHRVSLWILLCLNNADQCYWYEHYEGWPCLTWNSPYGQISYHVPESKKYLFEKAIEEVEKQVGESLFDGHSSEQVIGRLNANSEESCRAVR